MRPISVLFLVSSGTCASWNNKVFKEFSQEKRVRPAWLRELQICMKGILHLDLAYTSEHLADEHPPRSRLGLGFWVGPLTPCSSSRGDLVENEHPFWLNVAACLLKVFLKS